MRSFHKIFLFLLVFILLVNALTIIQAYQFTNYGDEGSQQTESIENLSLLDKLSASILGANIPKPQCEIKGDFDEELIETGTGKISILKKEQTPSLGNALLFHGYNGCKGSLVEEAEYLYSLNYSVYLVDFLGHGHSSGNSVTLGYKEADQVKIIFENYAGENTILVGQSMGAVAIMRAIHEYGIQPDKIILEAPYDNLLNTVRNRFELMGLPKYGGPELLTFWGGVINGFWAFSLSAETYASSISMPTLLMSGAEDEKADSEGIESIYVKIPGEKNLTFFEKAAHQDLMDHDIALWEKTVQEFIKD